MMSKGYLQKLNLVALLNNSHPMSCITRGTKATTFCFSHYHHTYSLIFIDKCMSSPSIDKKVDDGSSGFSTNDHSSLYASPLNISKVC